MQSHAPKAEHSPAPRRSEPAGPDVAESRGVQRKAAVGSRIASSFRPDAPPAAPSAAAQAPVQRSASTGVVQQIRVGYVPGLNWTGNTPYAGLADPTGARLGGRGFADAQKNAIYNDNIANFGARPARPAHNGPVSDISGAQLLERDEASDITPEIDHIVKVEFEGANDVANGRVLSKTENNQTFGISRPQPAHRAMKVYENINVAGGPNNGNWAANDGDLLSLDEVGDLLHYANGGAAPTSNTAAAQPRVARAIKVVGKGNTRNGVTIT